ncbi:MULTISPECIES: PACE efflux transporter [unclassified Pseudomonas]|uniref:PACE efflux transporter n=1 Tax=unclassified Pseudomonas TaxID=196821 RepID=UPI00244C6056|nr:MULTISPECIES: PACE efflux transporter [unclassified Pseudomonas]MDG9922918.1 PACE efflux transporter [Pseudomonas sp. GD04045]MDH0035718.1 PACE efflux transporter [Pseudomonas sp. GD04019]
MQGAKRKVVQALLYELIGALFVSPVIAFAFDESMVYSGTLALLLSLVALSWNMLFNGLFEYWEARQKRRTRTLGRRLLHSLGFEGGLALMLVPLMAWWLDISWWQALVADLGLLLFFFFYAFAFQWAFDLLFGVPNSAVEICQE